MRHRFITSALVVMLALSTWAKPKIERIKAKRGSSIISIHFDNPLPSAADVANKDFWIVAGEFKTGIHRYVVSSVEPCLSPADVKPPDCNAVDGYVRLHLTENVLADNTKIDLTLINNTAVINVPAFQLSKDQSGPLGTSKSKNDSDVYFSGSYTAVVDGDPVWDVDAFAGYMYPLKHGHLGKFGFYGQARTKKSDNADPNSFLDYLVWQKDIPLWNTWLGPFQTPFFNYRVAGTEFDRDGKQLNFINSPVVTLPLRFSGKISDPLAPSVTFPSMTLQFGTEFVKVEKSRVLAPEKNWYTRGLLGATFSAGYAPEKPAFDSITFSSAYQVRLPTAGEIYFDKRKAPIDRKTGKRGTTPALLGTQARHNVDSKISYNFTKYLGISFEHTYGSLPPIFTRNDHSFALGFTLTLKQTTYGRYSILRP